jgi:FkbM family methyltransferase
MKMVFDFGMYDASDTEYYLEEGFKVVAVEANPALANSATHIFSQYIHSGQLAVINAAINSDGQDVELTLSGHDLGSSSIFREKVESRVPLATFTVPGLTTKTLIERYGVPYYIKVDIEGADRLAILGLSTTTKPRYLSFEIGDDLEELMGHLCSIGFAEFKAINQCTLRDLSNEYTWMDKLSHKVIGALGFREPQYVKRAGRYFKVYHSSGPGPWASDSGWRSRQEFLRLWHRPKASDHRNVWYDLHAR